MTREYIPCFVVQKSPNGMNSISIRNPTQKMRLFLRSVVTNNWMESFEYRVRSAAGAFLQSYSKDYVLIEFWKSDFNDFIEFINHPTNYDEFEVIYDDLTPDPYDPASLK